MIRSRKINETYVVNDIMDVSDELERNRRYGKNTTGKIGEWAIVEKDGPMIKLLQTFNYNSPDPITAETYSDKGWYYLADELTEENFWDVWSIWSGFVRGGIEEEDGLDETEVAKRISANEEVKVKDLDNVPDGIYSVLV